MICFPLMKMKSLFFAVICWLLLIMNCGLGQNRGFISIISGWVNMSIFVVQSMILILFQIMPSIHCVKIAKEEFGSVLISEE